VLHHQHRLDDYCRLYIEHFRQLFFFSLSTSICYLRVASSNKISSSILSATASSFTPSPRPSTTDNTMAPGLMVTFNERTNEEIRV
jgi:hypothetical protein